MQITITIDSLPAQRELIAALATGPTREAFLSYLDKIAAEFQEALREQAPGAILGAAALTCRPPAALLQQQGAAPFGDWIANLTPDMITVEAFISARV